MDRERYLKEYYQKNKSEINRKKKIFRQRPEIKLKIIKYNQEYRKKNRKKIKEYNDRLEVKQKLKEYMDRPIVKRMREEYNSQPEVKARRKEYYQKNKINIIKKCVICNNLFKPIRSQKSCSIKCKEQRKKEVMRKYNQEYSQRPMIKEMKKEYYQSEEYKLIKRRYQKQRRKQDKNFAMEGKLRTLFYIALQKYSKTGKIMSSNKYSVDYKEIIEHLGPKPEDGNIYEVDHIIPISLFDLNDQEQIKKAFAPENHQWLTKEINRWKGNRLIKPLTDEEKEKLQAELTKNN